MTPIFGSASNENAFFDKSIIRPYFLNPPLSLTMMIIFLPVPLLVTRSHVPSGASLYAAKSSPCSSRIYRELPSAVGQCFSGLYLHASVEYQEAFPVSANALLAVIRKARITAFFKFRLYHAR